MPSETTSLEIAPGARSEPKAYFDAWARLQVQRPSIVQNEEWRQAVEDAGLFLNDWGAQALHFEWSPANLFDVPRDGSAGGLVWFLQDEAVRALGPEYAIADSTLCGWSSSSAAPHSRVFCRRKYRCLSPISRR
jgi:hypothetical protein